MQPSVHLNQRDIVRLQNAIGRLLAIGEALLGKNGHGTEEPKKKRRRRKRTSGETPAQPTRRRGRPPGPPSGSSSPE